MRSVRTFWAASLIVSLLAVGCPGRRTAAAAPTQPAAFPAASFSVMSDLHVYDTTLGTSGPAFREYLATDRKLLRESKEITTAAINRIIEEKPDFVIVAGDLTKDGESQSHDQAAACLRPLREQNIPVFVVPGNHDIANPEAVRYDEEGEAPVPSISPREFAERYADFGYDQAFDRDTSSLSYAAEPVPGLWLVGLDANRYYDNRPGRRLVIAGRLRPRTMAWLTQVLGRAAQKRIPVIVFMHHGVLEHFSGQQGQAPDYLVTGRKHIRSLFKRYGVRTVFTGHFHAQDIVVRTWPDAGFLYDIETGSLVTYPLPYRHVEIADNQNMLILTRRIEAIPSHPVDFPGYARDFTRQGLTDAGQRLLRRYHMLQAGGPAFTSMVADLITDHYAGDEPGTTFSISPSGFGCLTAFLIGARWDILKGLSRDLPPPDNDLLINLATGQWLLPR